MTTIHVQIEKKVHQKLTELGGKKESYSQIISRLIDQIPKKVA